MNSKNLQTTPRNRLLILVSLLAVKDCLVRDQKQVVQII